MLSYFHMPLKYDISNENQLNILDLTLVMDKKHPAWVGFTLAPLGQCSAAVVSTFPGTLDHATCAQ